MQKLTSPSFKVPPPRKMSLAKLFHPKSKVPLDEGMAVIFKGPKSFTGEDVVELHIHGSRGVVDGVIEAGEMCDVAAFSSSSPPLLTPIPQPSM